MRFYEKTDPFVGKQPKIDFATILAKPLHEQKPPHWNQNAPGADEVDFSSLSLRLDFCDELLETAYADFNNFMAVMGIKERDGAPTLSTERGETECFEAYIIEVTAEGCRIIANDTEGIRRALVYVEDEMQRREGARLPLGRIERKPYIKSRVSRCYFTPASHVAIEKTENELVYDVDFYPDEYLNRLAHDGINALWLGATLQYLVKSDIVPEYGEDAERRMARLNETIKKCKRYGIKTYLFAVDPASSYKNDKILLHPDMLEDADNWIQHVCPSTEKGVAYIKEAVTRLFLGAPELAGFINLTVGEAESTCASGSFKCKRCRAKFGSRAKTLNFVEKTIADTIAEVAPHAEYVSWTYAIRNANPKDIDESCLGRSANVRNLVNFEDLGHVEQLGKTRLAYDYWLSYAGPGELFKRCTEMNRRAGVKTWAKIQTCSSHEISTVPYVPVPSLLYDKYKYMHDNGIDGVMQCWFFGNYPCIMNKAAGELSFEPFPDKSEFLERLAGVYWGKDAKKVARALDLLAEGYSNFPVGVAFEWFSTLQDSPCAPYHLDPIDLPLPSTWLDTDMVGGDRIGDCIFNSHTLPEVIELCTTMTDKWCEGARLLSEIETYGYEPRYEQYNVVKAAGLMFESGTDTYKFYKLRRDFAIGLADSLKVLSEMRDIVNREIEISRELIPLTEADPRIGYHSEAHGYKVFPDKLRWRIGEMEKLLCTEFPAAEKRVNNREPLLPFYEGTENGARRYSIRSCDVNRAEWMNFTDRQGNPRPTTSVRVALEGDEYCFQFRLCGKGDTLKIDPEFHMFHRLAPIVLKDGEISLSLNYGYSLFGEKIDEYKSRFKLSHFCEGDIEFYELRFRYADFEMEVIEPFRMMITRSGQYDDVAAPDDRIFSRLVQGTFSPDAFCFFVPAYRYEAAKPEDYAIPKTNGKVVWRR